MAGQGGGHGLRFAILGPVRAWRDGHELDLGTPLQRSILAMLLLREGRAVTPGEIIDAVWGEDAPPRALGALRTYISRLRSALEPGRTTAPEDSSPSTTWGGTRSWSKVTTSQPDANSSAVGTSSSSPLTVGAAV